MERHFENDLGKLKADVLTAMRMAQTAVDKALRSIFQRDAAIADEVITGDSAIDALECTLDDEILRLLALRQPVAGDLRYILGCMRAVGDIERIGDQAVNIAERGLLLLERPPAPPSPNLEKLADATREFLVRATVCFMDLNLELARRLQQEGNTILALNEALLKEMTTFMLEESRPAERAIQLCFIAHGLRRVCDQCTNLAESVIFIREGAYNRH